MTDTLKKIYYAQHDIYKKTYEERFNSPFTVHFDFEINLIC